MNYLHNTQIFIVKRLFLPKIRLLLQNHDELGTAHIQ